jgi:5-methylcytosine-specific restriction endonuclease McrA
VARALGDLVDMEDALARGELAYSAIRELTRVATPGTEPAWLAAARGKNLRQIEELVAGHRPGDRPEDPRDPDVRMHVVRFELKPETYAALRRARAVLEDEHGRHLDGDELVGALVACIADRPAQPTGRAKYQVAMTICERCRQGWQHGAGAKIAVGANAVERAECDAQHIGDGRAHQDVPPAVARAIWHRDGGRCRVPGCRSARGLEIHHLVHRANGGTHDPSNLILACSSCHQAHHDGRLVIHGTAELLEVNRPGAHVGVMKDAEAALVQLGWKAPIARAAVAEAASQLAPDTPLERLIFEALRRCRSPAASTMSS